ncbi:MULTISPECIES: hypothetical protein [Streptomyces]|uniref:hypothetical protein n=1 Tax=Streptomyces TaxID=1883 RepID=UPI00292E47EB|nr:hypothetical protein [Streptomyces sp. NEAU-HV9]
MAWSADRHKQGLFTDPPYYSPPATAGRSGRTYETVDDVKGLNLGTVMPVPGSRCICSRATGIAHARPTGGPVMTIA